MANSIKLKTWIAAARLRTLPLALAAIILGSLLAVFYGSFSGVVLLWSVITAICYQVLSNFANDLGDGLKGTDENRVGEKRAIASGAIGIAQMKAAVVLFVVLSLVSGTYLSIQATRTLDFKITLFFIGLGILATAAALNYTMGKRAYGYAGLGDLFVLVFFGWVGVVGSNFLHTNMLEPFILLPATAVGFLAMGVLNLNNMRDMETDANAGKKTLVVRLGRSKSKQYHIFLLAGAMVLQILYVWLTQPGLNGFLFLLVTPLLLKNGIAVYQARKPADFDPLLKPLAISTLLFCLLAGFGQSLQLILTNLNK